MECIVSQKTVVYTSQMASTVPLHAWVGPSEAFEILSRDPSEGSPAKDAEEDVLYGHGQNSYILRTAP